MNREIATSILGFATFLSATLGDGSVKTAYADDQARVGACIISLNGEIVKSYCNGNLPNTGGGSEVVRRMNDAVAEALAKTPESKAEPTSTPLRHSIFDIMNGVPYSDLRTPSR